MLFYFMAIRHFTNITLSSHFIHLYKFQTVMNYKYLYCIILFACLSQVGYSQIMPWRNLFQRQQTQQQIPTIEVVPSRISDGNARLSDIIESIEYVPLETTDDVLIGSIIPNTRGFDVSDNYIVVFCNQQTQVFLFSRDGRFIRRIGRRGQGPGEYTMLAGVFLDEKREQIFVLTIPQNILVYNLRGEFVRYMPTAHNRGSLTRLHNDHFFFHNSFKMPFVYEIRDINLQLVAEDVTNGLYRVLFSQGIGSAVDYLFNDKIHVRPWLFNDTIFSIENDFSFIPRFVVTAGSRTPSVDLLTADKDRFVNRAPGYVSISSIRQTANKLLLRYRFQNRTHHVYFDKNTERLFRFRSESGIPNDFDGGVDFWPHRQDNLIWYRFFHAYYLIENSGRIAPTGGAAAVQSFNRLIERLDPDDNPVLMIVRIRE